MIAIPNIEKPIYCYECQLRQGDCCLLLNEAVPSVMPLKRLDDCPIKEIVECKDCKWWDRDTHGCGQHSSLEAWWEEDFCSYGEM